MAKQMLSEKCTAVSSWDVVLSCTKDFDSDVKNISGFKDSTTAIRKTCR